MEVEADEAAFQSVVNGQGERGADVCIHRWLVVPIQQVQEAARVVGEAPAVRQVTDEADAGPARRRYVLINRTQAARVRKAHDILDLDHETALLDRCRNRVAGDLAMNRAGGPDRQKRGDEKWHPGTHNPSQALCRCLYQINHR
jgi:hypothetical protein